MGQVFKKFLKLIREKGWQLFLMMFFLIILAMLGSYYDSRGALLTAFIIIYSITSFISGYCSASYYSQHGGKLILKSIYKIGQYWIRTMFLTAMMFPFFCFFIGAILNTLALAYQSTMAVPFGTIVIIIILWSM